MACESCAPASAASRRWLIMLCSGLAYGGAGGVVQALGDGRGYVFVVASDLDLVDPTGRQSMISEGDVVQPRSEVVLRSSEPAHGVACCTLPAPGHPA
jgi:hypothetical protein